MLEQWKNLTEYFLVFLPKQPNFKHKNGLKGNNRYQWIKEKLEDKSTQSYRSFIAFASQDFETFLVQFQADAPQIHQLYPQMENLIFNLQLKFIKNDKIYNKVDLL